MGMETAGLILAGISVAGEVGKAYAQTESAREQQRSLDLMEKQTTLSYQQQKLQSMSSLEKFLDAQVANASVSGFAFSSPTFNAIQRATVNTGMQELSNLVLGENIAKRNIEMERRKVKNTLFAQLFGDVTETAFSAANIWTKMPTSGSF